MIDPLLIFLKAKDIPKVDKPLSEIDNVDKLLIKYFPYPYSLRIVENYFRVHPKYTHLIIYTVDVIVTQDHVNALIDTILNYHFDVVSGVMNVDLIENRDFWNITEKLPNRLNSQARKWNWIKRNSKQGIIKVGFAGLPLMAISRKVMNELKWIGDQPGHYNCDLNLCWQMQNLGIDRYCNTEIDLIHLRHIGEMQVGKKNPEIQFIPRKKNYDFN